MSGSFKQSINFPSTYEYSSDSENIPLEFYEEAFPLSKTIDLLLGYFSTNAIKVLSMSLAEFIYNGGSLRLVTNHFFSNSDYDFITESGNKVDDEIIDIFSDLQELQKNLSPEGKHFFDCLLYLKNQGRLDIKPVKFRGDSMSHSKIMILNDGTDIITTAGSINFTLSALLKNAEHFQVEVPWNGALSQMRISENVKKFNYIFNGTHPDYRHIGSDELIKVINTIGQPKELNELLDDSFNLTVNDEISQKITTIRNKRKIRFEEVLEKIRSTPRFPKSGTPRDYQIEAYENWVANDYKGLFAMATGTGKTKTALNCVLEEYKKTKKYNVIILVPSQILVNQWIEECKDFNFKNVFSSYTKDWNGKLKSILVNLKLGIESNFIFVCTYEVYNRELFQNIFRNLENQNFILIADEVHNLGTKRSLSNLLNGIQKRIGLSATPNRKYDEEGSKDIEKYFDSHSPKYTFSYSMLKAIQAGFLCEYIYQPYFVKLNEDELEQYYKISKDLLKYYDFANNKYRDEAKFLLIQRKRIIHKAEEKKSILNNLISKLINKSEKELKHTIIYVPEGSEDYEEHNIEEEDKRCIDEYTQIINSKNIRVHQVIGGMADRDVVLKQFESGTIQVLTAMKTLDEGVDIPATKHAIFCSSTGNERQYIQRRGRILRNFKGKDVAYVYDMIVEPSERISSLLSRDDQQKIIDMEKNIFKSEIYRVVNFLYAAKNSSEIHTSDDPNFNKLNQLTKKYDIDIFSLINNLKKIDLQ